MKNATIFYASAFGWASVEVKLESADYSQYAQYMRCPTVVYIQKGKRLKNKRWFTNNKAVIIKGFGHAKPDSAMVAMGDGCQMSKYPCYDSRYDADFAEWFDNLPNKTVIIDYRK